MNPYLNSKNMSSQAGFGVLSLLITMPLLLIVLGFFLHRWGELRDSKILRAECRSELARGQKDAGQKIQDLLDLNLPVKEAKLEMIAAKLALAAATASMNAPGVTAAREWMFTIQQRQHLLRAQQKLLIILGQKALTEAGLRAQLGIRRASTNVGFSHRQIRSLRLMPAQLAVREVRPVEEYPEYELKPQFEQNQKLELTWQSHYQNLAKERTWSLREAKIPENCGMTLRPQSRMGRGFSAVASQGKYFWKR